MTVDAVKNALLKLVGEKGSASVSFHKSARQDPHYRSESESWSGFLHVNLQGEPDAITAHVHEARSGELLISLLKAELKKAIHARAFARKHKAIEAPRPRIAQVLCLEHRP